MSDLPVGSYTFRALAADLGYNQTLETRQFSIAPVAEIGNVRVNNRARPGAHYASREDSLTIVELVLIVRLCRKWARCKSGQEAWPKTGTPSAGDGARSCTTALASC